MKCSKTLLFLVIVIGFLTITNLSNKVHGEENCNYTIYIDPGHGGYDDGAVFNGIVEKDLNLIIAKYLRSYLEQVGINVLMTREIDQDYSDDIMGIKKRSDLQTRIEMINQSNADIVISIHMNSMASNRWFGSQVFYYPERFENKVLAKTVMRNLQELLKNTTREAKEIKTLFLLKNIKKPGILVEGGFISNPNEALLLKDPKYQERLAYAIFIGVLEYLALN